MSEGAGTADPLRCTLIAGNFAKLVQFALLVGALAVLFYKREIEIPKRPLKIWFMDAFKQCYAGSLQHLVNMGLALFLGQGARAGECIWYFVNFTITVFCGIFILTWVMKAYDYIVEKYQWTILKSGEYGNPPQWTPWLAQMILWGFIASGEKLLTATVVILPLHPYLDAFAVWLERPFLGEPKLELVIVMVGAPVILNALFFWIVDNLIKGKSKEESKTSADGKDYKVMI